VGVGFTAKSTASLNGLALTGVKVAKDLKSLTGVVPPTSTIPKITDKVNLGGSTNNLTVTSEGGPSAATDGNPNSTQDDYKYVNSVTVAPKLASIAAGTTLTVTGKGFSTILNPTVGTPATNAKVLLIPGRQFNSTSVLAGFHTWPWISGSATGYDDSALLTAFGCTNVKVVSDTELTCKAPGLVTGSYTVTLVDNYLLAGSAGTTFNYQTVPSASATISVGAF
jgi:hypothetical protein